MPFYRDPVNSLLVVSGSGFTFSSVALLIVWTMAGRRVTLVLPICIRRD